MLPSLATTGLPAALLAVVLPAQGVLQVGPTRPYPTIQAAVQAAVDGSVIEVDAGSYPAFTIVGKRLTVIAHQSGGSGAVFTVAGAPAITITGLLPGQQVTIADAVATATATAPGIVISNADAGSVRLLNVVVLGGHFGVVPYAGFLEVRHTDSVWFDRVRAGDYRFRCNGAQGTTGLAALFVDASTVQLTRCVLQGARSDQATIGGGDALHIVGSDTAWGVDSHLVGGLPPLGALPGVRGGHAVHDGGGVSGPIRMCDCTLLTTDSAASVFAVLGATSYLMACLPDGIARTELPLGVTQLAPGATAVLTVRANVPNRAFVTLLATEFGSLTLPGLLGDLLVAGNFGILTAGVVVGPVSIPLSLPPQPALVGLQCTAQSALVETAASFVATTAAAFTIR